MQEMCIGWDIQLLQCPLQLINQLQWEHLKFLKRLEDPRWEETSRYFQLMTALEELIEVLSINQKKPKFIHQRGKMIIKM